MLQYIADRDHFTEVLSRCEQVKHDLWIGTADLKDLYVQGGRDVVPFLSVLDKLVKRGVEVRLLHAKEPGENFRADSDKYPGLWFRMERNLCPRVHFKIMVFDCSVAYIGSANLTGAGIGMKGEDCTLIPNITLDIAGLSFCFIYLSGEGVSQLSIGILGRKQIMRTGDFNAEFGDIVKQLFPEAKYRNMLFDFNLATEADTVPVVLVKDIAEKLVSIAPKIAEMAEKFRFA